MSIYTDIMTLRTTGCWPNKTEPEWALKLADRYGCCSTHSAVLQDGLISEIERLMAERDAAIRWAKAATNAYDDLFATCTEGTKLGRPMDIMHRDDWKRAKNWQTAIWSAREAAEKARKE